MKPTLLLLLCLSFLVACDSKPSPRQAAFKQANTFIKQGELKQAYAILDNTIFVGESGLVQDSAYYLHSDLKEVQDPEWLALQARILEESSNGWNLFEADKHPRDMGLHFKSSEAFAKPAIMALRAKAPAMVKAREIELAKESKARAAAEANAPIEKRVAAGKVLRELYLDNSQDVEVTISGKKKDQITLEYALIGDVWSHKMDKAGDITALLDLGFKKVILSDGYDYRMVWSRKN